MLMLHKIELLRKNAEESSGGCKKRPQCLSSRNRALYSTSLRSSLEVLYFHDIPGLSNVDTRHCISRSSLVSLSCLHQLQWYLRILVNWAGRLAQEGCDTVIGSGNVLVISGLRITIRDLLDHLLCWIYDVMCNRWITFLTYEHHILVGYLAPIQSNIKNTTMLTGDRRLLYKSLLVLLICGSNVDELWHNTCHLQFNQRKCKNELLC